MALTPLFGIPMGPELVVILLIAILLFGANKIPKLARSTGQALGEFEKGKTQAEQELEEIRDGATPDIDTDPLSSGDAADTSADTSTETASETTDADATTESSATEE